MLRFKSLSVQMSYLPPPQLFLPTQTLVCARWWVLCIRFILGLFFLLTKMQMPFSQKLEPLPCFKSRSNDLLDMIVDLLTLV